MKNHDLNFLELVESSLSIVGECDIHQVKSMMDGGEDFTLVDVREDRDCLLYTSPSPRDKHRSRMPSSA